MKRARISFENALSLDPTELDSKIDLAVLKIEHPKDGRPMTAVMDLIALGKKYPDNVTIMNQLGRLAIKTNQIDKAIVRLSKAEKLQPENKTTICLLAEAYGMSGETEAEREYKEKCLELNRFK